MATLDYVDVPAAATRLQARKSGGSANDIRPATKVLTSLPHPEKASRGPPSTPVHAQSPTKSGFNFQQVLLSSTFQIPANAPAAPRASKGAPKLLSTRDPLSLPITTANFRRFVARVGPVFWLQDRIEEIVMWRKGWKYTTVWICVYIFLGFYPRLCFLLPLVAALGVLLATHPPLSGSHQPAKVPPPPPAQADQWSLDWLSNVQAIQNLMGAVSDAHDFMYPAVPHLNHSSPYTPFILTLTVLLLIISFPLINFIPLRTTFLILGIVPFFLTHPFTHYTLIPLALEIAARHLVATRVRMAQLLDNDRLTDKHWRSELRTVELWENERWAPGLDEAAADGGWSKTNLRPGERKAWTRGRDGWSGIADDGTGDVSSNLTFSLSPGWLFVETEEWRPDLEGSWIGREFADDSGWVYTDDVWMNPAAAPRDEWKQSNGLTRRRRWVRRIYYDPAAASA